MAHASDVRGDHGPGRSESLDQGHRGPFVAARKDDDVQVGEGRRDVRPPPGEMSTSSDAQVARQAFQRRPKLAIAKYSQVKLRGGGQRLEQRGVVLDRYQPADGTGQGRPGAEPESPAQLARSPATGTRRPRTCPGRGQAG